LSQADIQQDKDTLRSLESQINTLANLIDRGKVHLRFPSDIEQDYRSFLLVQFVSVDLKIISAGLFVFLIFGWADFSFGGDKGAVLFSLRAAVTAVLFFAAVTLPRTPLLPYATPILVAGIYICSLVLMWNITNVEAPGTYYYHICMIPMQVFALLALRSNYRAMAVCSCMMLFTYSAFVAWYPMPEVMSDIDKMALSILPFYLLFWVILVGMAVYLSYTIELSTRNDFIKNRLLALEAQRLQYLGRRLEQLSTTDSLTGIANRRYIEDQLVEEWRRCSRNATPLVTVMLDVDYFKKYNDHYGHQQGDVCLKAIAKKISEFCRRPGDVCARYGGEEFLILLPGTATEVALGIAQDICQSIADMKLTHALSPHKVATVSMGVASVIPGDDKNYESLIRHADMALYEAKGNGRNQVCLAPTVSESDV